MISVAHIFFISVLFRFNFVFIPVFFFSFLNKKSNFSVKEKADKKILVFMTFKKKPFGKQKKISLHKMLAPSIKCNLGG